MTKRMSNQPLPITRSAGEPAFANLERQFRMILGDVAEVIRHTAAHIQVCIIVDYQPLAKTVPALTQRKIQRNLPGISGHSREGPTLAVGATCRSERPTPARAGTAIGRTHSLFPSRGSLRSASMPSRSSAGPSARSKGTGTPYRPGACGATARSKG